VIQSQQLLVGVDGHALIGEFSFAIVTAASHRAIITLGLGGMRN
jgi:hypothetical protein